MRRQPIKLMALAIVASMFVACGGEAPKKEQAPIPTTDIPVEGEQVVAELTSPPHVPKPVGTRGAMKLKVDL